MGQAMPAVYSTDTDGLWNSWSNKKSELDNQPGQVRNGNFKSYLEYTIVAVESQASKGFYPFFAALLRY
jgi:hypothetical protein